MSKYMKGKSIDDRPVLDKVRVDRLAARFKGGDAGAFDELVLIFQRPVFNLAYRMLNNYEEANDAVQEIFVKVYRSIGKFKGRSSFSTWLYAVAANICRNRLRRIKRISTFEVRTSDLRSAGDNDCREPVAVDPCPAPDRTAELSDIKRSVEKAVASLQPDFASVIVMKDIQNMRYEEIAETLGCSLGTVKSRLSRARMMMKEKLQLLLT